VLGQEWLREPAVEWAPVPASSRPAAVVLVPELGQVLVPVPASRQLELVQAWR